MDFMHASIFSKYRGQLVGAQHLGNRPRGGWGRQGVLPLTSSAVATLMSKSLDGRVQVQQEFCFYSSSVLIMYEGDAETAEEANVSVRFVDFAHTFPSGGQRDGNFIQGLSALTSMLSAVACSGQYRGLV